MCSVAECDRGVYARGLCGRHYKQQLRHGEVQPDRAPRECAVPGCQRRAVTRDWCHGHYTRWDRTGDVQAHKPLARPVRDECKLDGCERGAHSAGWCRSHARRVKLYGDPHGGRPARMRKAGGSLNHGYWWVVVPLHLRHLVPEGRTQDFEHRLVMAQVLQRPLRADETVHHVNGDRLDNRPDNLELWSTSQPKGQRVSDKVDWAREILRRYAPDEVTTIEAEQVTPDD